MSRFAVLSVPMYSRLYFKKKIIINLSLLPIYLINQSESSDRCVLTENHLELYQTLKLNVHQHKVIYFRKIPRLFSSAEAPG